MAINLIFKIAAKSTGVGCCCGRCQRKCDHICKKCGRCNLCCKCDKQPQAPVVQQSVAQAPKQIGEINVVEKQGFAGGNINKRSFASVPSRPAVQPVMNVSIPTVANNNVSLTGSIF